MTQQQMLSFHCRATAALPPPAPPTPPPLHSAQGVGEGGLAFVRPTCARANILCKRWRRAGLARTGADVRCAASSGSAAPSSATGLRTCWGRACAANFFIMASPTRVLAVACVLALSRQDLGTSGSNPPVRIADMVRAKQHDMPAE